jgi:hypothetical protein
VAVVQRNRGSKPVRLFDVRRERRDFPVGVDPPATFAPAGSNRQDFTNQMIATLQSGADSLVVANPNQEGAYLLALQTRQQLSTTALSLSAQSDRNVLKLFS